jgi:SAM-dependent methyltransferase
MNRPANSLESDYYQHQNFDPAHALEVRSFYLQFLEDSRFLIELGCGRGEFLEAAQRSGKRALGVDIDPGMIAETRSRDLEAVEQDAIEFLRTTAEEPDALFAAHLIEHLTVEDALELLNAACHRIRPGGVLVVVTPNPQCLAIILSDFWNDPTHVRPYTIPLLEFLARQAGLEILTSGFNPIDEPGPPPELLVPDTLAPWRELEMPELPPWSSEQLDVEDSGTKRSLYALLQRVYDVNHTLFQQIKILDERLDQIRHQTQVASASMNKALRHHYGPNEIYVVARRPV